jgi:hypothetical protein
LADEQRLRSIYLNQVSIAGRPTAKGYESPRASAKAAEFARKEAERRVGNELERVRKLDILAAQLRAQGKEIFLSKTGIIISESEAAALTEAAAAGKAPKTSAHGAKVEERQTLSELVAQLPTPLPANRPMTRSSSEMLLPSSQAQSARARSPPPGPPRRGPNASRNAAGTGVDAPSSGGPATFVSSPLSKGSSAANRLGGRRDPAVWGAFGVVDPDPSGSEPSSTGLTSQTHPRLAWPATSTASEAWPPAETYGPPTDEQAAPLPESRVSPDPVNRAGASSLATKRDPSKPVRRFSDPAVLPAKASSGRTSCFLSHSALPRR